LLLCGYVLVRGLFLASIVPPWQGPDEPGHAEYAVLLARAHAWRPVQDDQVEGSILESMSRHRFYNYLHLPLPAVSPQVFADVKRLGGAPTQLDSELPLGYLPHGIAAALTTRSGVSSGPELDALLHRMRMASLALAIATVVASWWAVRPAVGRRRALAVAVLVATTPALVFGGAVVNNDLAAAALCAIWFGVLARGLGRGMAGRDWVLLLALALLAAATKRTALYLLPTLALLVLWRLAGSLSRERIAGALRSDDAASRPERVRLVALGALAISCLLAIAAMWPVDELAASWRRAGRPWGAYRASEAARGLGHGLRVVDEQVREWQYLEQRVSVSGGEPFEASVWLRAAPPGTSGEAQLAVSDDSGTWTSSVVDLTDVWQHVTLEGRLAPEARQARLALVPGPGSIEDTAAIDADDATFVVAGSERLANGDAETPMRVATVLVTALAAYTDAPRVATAAVAGLADPVESIRRTRRALVFLFRSYWGGYGWLTLWPPLALYAGAAVVTGAVLGGLVLALLAPARVATSPAEAQLARVGAAAVCAAVVVVLLGSVAGRGIEGIPQGRYLLAAVVPLVLPAVLLLDRLSPRWGVWSLSALVLAMDVIAVTYVIWPGFHPGA
jgi:hypothetical protein